jgi:hypothetical protein
MGQALRQQNLVSNETEMPPGGPIDAFGQKLNIDLRRIIEAP